MKWRLFVAIAGVLTLILVGQDIPVARYLRSAEHDRVVASLERDAFIMAGGAAESVLDPQSVEQAALTTNISDYARRTGGKVIVVDRFGEAIAASDPADRGRTFASRPEVASALKGTPTEGRRASQTAGQELAYIAVPVLDGGRIVGALRITFPTSTIDDRVDPALRGLLIAFAISMVAALLVALLVANQLGAPLRRLQLTTQHLAAGDFSVRADAGRGPGELRSLAASFNAMTERIEELVDKQRAFAGDASHQLRSPLTALRLQLEQAAASDDPQLVRARLDAAVTETERLQRLVDGLLMLARSSSGAAPVVAVAVDEVVDERVETWSSLGAERGVRVVGDVQRGVVVVAVASAVEQILDNYLDNAMAAAPDGSTITVTVRKVGPKAAIHVLDEGPGIPAEHLGRAFDRFWRAPDAAHQGSGIGLAIVNQLAIASGGRVEISNRVGRSGLDACVWLPLRNPS